MAYSCSMQPHLSGYDDMHASVYVCERTEQSEALIVSHINAAEKLRSSMEQFIHCPLHIWVNVSSLD